MKLNLSALLLTLLLICSSCKTTEDPILLVVGDSWGQIMCGFKTFDDVLSEYGYKNKAECLLTTKSGTWAKDWAQPGALNNAKTILVNNSEIKTIYVSAGGNDLLGTWNKSMSDAELDKIFNEVSDHLRVIFKELLQVRPDAKIVISAYDFPNFDLLPPGDTLSSYRKLYNKMGQPSVVEINAVVVKFSERMVKLSEEFDRVYFVPTLGLGQNTYGLPDLNILPGALPRPSLDQLIGGDPLLPQPRRALLDIEGTFVVDPYHLGKSGFKNFARHIMSIHMDRLLKE